jgi:outer membrane lipoprotein-sorting protein
MSTRAPAWALAALIALGSLAGGLSATAQPLAEPSGSVEAQVQALLDEASKTMAGIYDYQGVIVKRELFGDELVTQKLAFKFSRPFKVYVKYLDPYEGREGLYVRGRYNNKLRAHRGSVPDIMVSLNPRGRIAMIENHHPITSFGLENMLKLAKRNIEKAIARGDAKLSLSAGGMIRGEPTWRIDMETHARGYTVKARRGETLWDIARRTKQDMYVILHHNDDIDSPTDLSSGQEVFVPHYYASRGEYFISKRSYMMIMAISWDHHGDLYESYDYVELELNPGLEDREFDHRNKDYEFVLVNQR